MRKYTACANARQTGRSCSHHQKNIPAPYRRLCASETTSDVEFGRGGDSVRSATAESRAELVRPMSPSCSIGEIEAPETQSGLITPAPDDFTQCWELPTSVLTVHGAESREVGRWGKGANGPASGNGVIGESRPFRLGKGALMAISGDSVSWDRMSSCRVSLTTGWSSRGSSAERFRICGRIRLRPDGCAWSNA